MRTAEKVCAMQPLYFNHIRVLFLVKLLTIRDFQLVKYLDLLAEFGVGGIQLESTLF